MHGQQYIKKTFNYFFSRVGLRTYQHSCIGMC